VSISCALVCIIIVVTASFIGLFSIFRHQISAMLITAVMYLLAGNFNYILTKKNMIKINLIQNFTFLDIWIYI